MTQFLNYAMQQRFGSPAIQQMQSWGGVQPLISPSAKYNLSDYGLKAPAAAPSFSLMEGMPDLGIDPGLSELNLPKTPDKKGAWIKPASFGLGVAQVGLNLFNAIDQAKVNKFMRGYYGDQMALQKADFSNAARSANEALEGKRSRQLSAMGMGVGSEANTKGVADYMAKWGAKETV